MYVSPSESGTTFHDHTQHIDKLQFCIIYYLNLFIECGKININSSISGVVYHFHYNCFSIHFVWEGGILAAKFFVVRNLLPTYAVL